MSEPPPTAPVPAELTSRAALANAARLLDNAELETNLPLMERLEKLADSWISIASMLNSFEREP
jgi:hypothetical protein